MSFLSQITTGKVRQPLLMLVYGVDGVGKSSFAASAPNPVFLGPERGSANLDVARLPSPTSFAQALDMIEELATTKHDFQSLVIDSLDWLEPLVWEQVVTDANKKDIHHIEDFGYGKGYALAMPHWNKLIGKINKVRETRGMNTVIIAHSHVKAAKDPQNQTEYDRYQLKLNDKAAALFREYVDYVFFANFEVVTSKEKGGKVRAYGDGIRYLYTERRPGFDAKSRTRLPFQIDLSWESFMDSYLEDMSPNPDGIIAEITSMLEHIEDEALKAKIIKSVQMANSNVSELDRIANKLRTVTSSAA
jgi:hypothetical protein